MDNRLTQSISQLSEPDKKALGQAFEAEVTKARIQEGLFFCFCFSSTLLLPFSIPLFTEYSPPFQPPSFHTSPPGPNHSNPPQSSFFLSHPPFPFFQTPPPKKTKKSAVHSITDRCWSKCITGRISSGNLESGEEKCAANCVERFLDLNVSVVRQLRVVRGE